MQADASVVRERKGDFWVRQRDALDRFGAMREFGGFRLEKLPPGRRVVVQVAHFNDGACTKRGRFRRGTRFGAQAPGVACALLPAGQCQARDGSDRGQRFTAEAERGDAFQIVERCNLRRRVALEGQRDGPAGCTCQRRAAGGGCALHARVGEDRGRSCDAA